MGGLGRGNGDGLALQLPRIFNAVGRHQHIAVPVAQRHRPQIDALVFRAYGQLDEHRGPVDAPGIQRIHQIGPGAKFLKAHRHAAAVAFKLLFHLEYRQRVGDRQITDGHRLAARFGAGARRAARRPPAAHTQRRHRHGCQSKAQPPSFFHFCPPASLFYFLSQPRTARLAFMSATICSPSAFGSTLTRITEPSVSRVPSFKNSMTFFEPKIGASTQW